MATKKKIVDPNHPLEIEVTTYWPTRIIKELRITNPSKDSWHNDITLSKDEAQYLYDQLTPMFSNVKLAVVKPKEENEKA